MNPLAIDVRNLTKTFIQGETPIEVLRGIDLQLPAGETLAILGQSGSGKSTLLSLLAGLDQPTEGSIHIDGHDMTTMSEENLAAFRARSLGIVFQQFHLMAHLTALENVTLPLELAKDPKALEKGNEALDKVALGPRQSHFPSQLSGGERQRVAIARAFVVEPRLLLADEPSGNLDQRTGVHVVQLLFDLVERHKTTLILVTHNEELAQRCHRQVHLVDGKLT